MIRQQIEMQRYMTLCRDGVAQRRRQRVDQAAFKTIVADYEFAVALMSHAFGIGEGCEHGFQRLPGVTFTQMRAPRNFKTTVGRS